MVSFSHRPLVKPVPWPLQSSYTVPHQYLVTESLLKPPPGREWTAFASKFVHIGVRPLRTHVVAIWKMLLLPVIAQIQHPFFLQSQLVGHPLQEFAQSLGLDTRVDRLYISPYGVRSVFHASVGTYPLSRRPPAREYALLAQTSR